MRRKSRSMKAFRNFSSTAYPPCHHNHQIPLKNPNSCTWTPTSANCEQLAVRSPTPGGPNKIRLEVHEKMMEGRFMPWVCAHEVEDNASLKALRQPEPSGKVSLKAFTEGPKIQLIPLFHLV